MDVRFRVGYYSIERASLYPLGWERPMVVSRSQVLEPLPWSRRPNQPRGGDVGFGVEAYA